MSEVVSSNLKAFGIASSCLALATLWMWKKRRPKKPFAQLNLEENDENDGDDDDSSKHHVCIIGCGFGGICAAIKLKEAGIPFTVVEAEDGPGGVWKNNYPGQACDVASMLYSFSFELFNWTRKYAYQEEILGYLEQVVEKYQLSAHCYFGTYVEAAYFDSKSSEWIMKFTKAGSSNNAIPLPTRTRFSHVIAATGQLSSPAFPNVKGAMRRGEERDETQETTTAFQGDSFHTAQWRHDVSLRDKKVVAIGTGPSAAQAFPAIAPLVNKLYVIQRSPTYLINRNDGPYSSLQQTFFAWFPLSRQVLRWQIFLYGEWLFKLAFRDKTGQSKWAKTVRDSASVAFMEKQIEQHEPDFEVPPSRREQLRKEVIPPATVPMGCKRVMLVDEWIPMLKRPNVELITQPLVEIVEDGVIVGSKSESPGSQRKLEADVIIYGTGFNSREFCSHIDIKAEQDDGRVISLCDHWNDKPSAYLSIHVPKFPNFFLIYGPGSNLGHNSILLMIEEQVDHIVKLILHQIHKKADKVVVKDGIASEWNQKLQSSLSDTVFASPACTSWYKTGDGTVLNNWGGTVREFQSTLRTSPDLEHHFLYYYRGNNKPNSRL